MTLASWVLKPEEETPPCPRLTKEGIGFRSFQSFRWILTRAGWADASRAQFPQPALAVSSPVSHFIAKSGSEPVGACNDHTQHPRECFWGVACGGGLPPWVRCVRAFLSALNSTPFPSLIPLSLLKSRGPSPPLFSEKPCRTPRSGERSRECSGSPGDNVDVGLQKNEATGLFLFPQ